MVRGAVLAVACAVVFAMSPGPAKAGDTGRIRFRISLHPPAKLDAPKGKAKYEQRDSGRKKLSVEAEHIANVTTIEVFVDSQSVGTAPMTACAAELELDTEKGDTVPTMTQSSLVEVFDADTDTKLLTSAP